MDKAIKLPKSTLELKRGRIAKNLAKTALRAELFRDELKSKEIVNEYASTIGRTDFESAKDESERRGATATEREDESISEKSK